MAGGDGRWRVEKTGEWTKRDGLRVFKPLWPAAPTNFHQRLVRLAYSSVSVLYYTVSKIKMLPLVLNFVMIFQYRVAANFRACQ